MDPGIDKRRWEEVRIAFDELADLDDVIAGPQRRRDRVRIPSSRARPLTSARHADIAGCTGWLGDSIKPSGPRWLQLRLIPWDRLGIWRLAARRQQRVSTPTRLPHKRGLPSSGGNRVFLAQLGYGYARTGQSTEAHDILRQLHELCRAQLVSPYYLVQVYLGLGARDSALTWLEKSQKERWGHLAFIRANSVWDPLRTEPRFKRLMEHLELRVHHN